MFYIHSFNLSLRTFLCTFVYVVLLFSCVEKEQSDDPSSQKVEFSFRLSTESVDRNARIEETNITSIRLSITDSNDNAILTQQKLNVIGFGESLITEPVALSIGDYSLTEFFVLDEEDSIIYAVPTVDSPLSDFISQPLPISFSVLKDDFTSISLEVIAVDGSTASDFGYSSFQFEKIDAMGFLMSVIGIDTVEGDQYVFLESRVSVVADGITLYDDSLEARVNTIFLDTVSQTTGNAYNNYTVNVLTDGYEAYSETFTHEEFMTYEDTLLSVSLNVSLNWTLIGDPVLGAADFSVINVDGINDAGNVISTYASDADRRVIRIYEETSGVWTQVGQDIFTKSIGAASTMTVRMKLNGQGNIFVASTYGSGLLAETKVYQNLAGTWTQIGSTIFDEDEAGDRQGEGTDINEAGDIIAIGIPFADRGGATNGVVKVYENIGGVWTQLGSDLEGDFGDRFGRQLRLNSAGDMLVVGVPRGDAGGNDSGEISVFEYTGGDWIQVGQTIAGESAGDLFGRQIAMNAAGDIILGGSVSNGADVNSSRYYRAYRNASGTWVQIGQDIDTENDANGFGAFGTSMNAAGDIFALSSELYSTVDGTSLGRVNVYSLESDTWVQLGESIVGEAEEGFLGNPQLNASGSILSVAETGHDNAGGVNAGRVSTYELR